MKYIELFGKDIASEARLIKNELEADPKVVFVYSGLEPEHLYDYIESLCQVEDGLDDEVLYKFKVCYEKRDLSVSLTQGNAEECKIGSVSELVAALDGDSNCKIVVEKLEDDDNCKKARCQLAFLVQQLIFIEYRLDLVDVLLRKEERDAAKTERFKSNLYNIIDGCKSAVEGLQSLKDDIASEGTLSEAEAKFKQERLNDVEEALESCSKIQEQLDKAKQVELKLAVMASKKAGKSVIVNDFIGEEIAPTSTELATPNNCIYKKSLDEKYRLQMDGKADQEFDRCEEIKAVIGDYFKKAQNDKNNNFALPDMTIEYVSPGNNFSSYTIYDTAGPDAAGTDHGKVAENALQVCDVAVFAIDYAKYLTETEEKYLGHVKEVFGQKGKFHSLVFALNKFDVRYNDSSSCKSAVKSVDFIKTRLANINEEYRDSIIFPTSSLEYFSALEAERANIAELADGKSVDSGELKLLKMKKENKKVAALQWLHTQSENLEYFNGVESFSYDVFKKDSGMPALMDYVSYVTTSKAREEIVNNISMKIDSQKVQLQSIFDEIANIEQLIHVSREKIGKIKIILGEYVDEVEEIFSEQISTTDLLVLEKDANLRTCHNSRLWYGEYLRGLSQKAVNTDFAGKVVADGVYNAVWQMLYDRLSGNELSGTEISELLSPSDLCDAARELAKKRAPEYANKVRDWSEKCLNELKLVIADRCRRFEIANEKCRENLSIEGVRFDLPKLPNFEFATQMVYPKEYVVPNVDLRLDLFAKLRGSFEGAGLWQKFWSWFWSAEDAKYRLKINKDEFKEKCDNTISGDIRSCVYDSQMADHLAKSLNAHLGPYGDGLAGEMRDAFSSRNKTYDACMKKFSNIVDESDKLRQNIDYFRKRQENIARIQECTKDLLNVWDMVVCGDDLNDVEPDDFNRSRVNIVDTNM